MKSNAHCMPHKEQKACILVIFRQSAIKKTLKISIILWQKWFLCKKSRIDKIKTGAIIALYDFTKIKSFHAVNFNQSV